MKRWSAVAIALLVQACAGGDGDGGEPEQCDAPDGPYETQHVERSGDCGFGTFTAIQPFGEFADDSDAVCTGPVVDSADGCKRDVNVRCVFDDGDVIEIVGTYWITRSDGTAFKSTLMTTISLNVPGDVPCTSIVDSMGEKL